MAALSTTPSTTDTATDYTLISDVTSLTYLLNTFVIGAVVAVVVGYFIFVTKQRISDPQDRPNRYYRYALYFAQACYSSALFAVLFFMFFSTDLGIAFPSSSNARESYITIVDFIMHCANVPQQLFLFYAFTFHAHSLRAIHKRMSVATKVWMVAMTVFYVTALALYLIDDALVFSGTEVGYTPTHNYSVILNLGLPEAVWLQQVVAAGVALEAFYYGYIAVLYVSVLRQEGKDNKSNLANKGTVKQSVRGLVLVIVCCVILVLNVTLTVLDADIKYLLLNGLYLVDTACLFMVFRGNESTYESMCGPLCDRCCVRMFALHRYESMVNIDTEDESLVDI